MATEVQAPPAFSESCLLWPGQRTRSGVLRPVPLGPGLFQAPGVPVNLRPPPTRAARGTYCAQGSLRHDLV